MEQFVAQGNVLLNQMSFQFWLIHEVPVRLHQLIGKILNIVLPRIFCFLETDWGHTSPITIFVEVIIYLLLVFQPLPATNCSVVSNEYPIPNWMIKRRDNPKDKCTIETTIFRWNNELIQTYNLYFYITFYFLFYLTINALDFEINEKLHLCIDSLPSYVAVACCIEVDPI